MTCDELDAQSNTFADGPALGLWGGALLQLQRLLHNRDMALTSRDTKLLFQQK